ncbi:hypothetical protein Mapa_015060 [Marchantia paleacea]|nr:hypothetical protein Mapa_015060 [Marchantia paleacea]
MAVPVKGASVLCFSLLLTAHMAFAQYNASNVLTPPLGNSPSVVVYTRDGYQLYSCLKGTWSLKGSYAILMYEDSRTEAGNVTSKVDGNGELYTWTLLNSLGDAAESGFSASMVSGKPLAWEYPNRNSLAQQLVESTSHQYYGAAATVSYIQRYSTSGGLPPSASTCTVDNSVVKVPYSAKYCLWTQDTTPASVPRSLVVPNGRVVEGFFGKGHVTFKHNGRVWEEVAKYAKLYNLPGTEPIGEYYVNGGDDCWNIYNPNGWIVYAKRTSKPVEVVRNCMPWTLLAVTGEKGVPVMLGPFNFVQTTSTRGGIPPTTKGASKGAMSYSGYSAIYWFYTVSVG